MKITIYTLEGCGFCEKLIKDLQIAGIMFSNKVCKEANRECDKLESVTNCNLYPMCLLEIANKKVFACLTNDSSQLYSTKQIDQSTSIIYVYSINNIMSIIKDNYF